MMVANAPQHVGAVDGSRHGRILCRALLTVCVLALVLGVIVYCHTRGIGAPDCSQWETVFDSYGEASCSDDLLHLKPMSADFHDTTHAGLVTSTSVEIEPGSVQTIHIMMIIVRQLCKGGDPNAWEVAWLLWDYTDNSHFYTLVLKPNSWEISKQNTTYPGYQRLLSSGNTLVYPPGKSHDVTVIIDTTKPSEATFTTTMNGQEFETVTGKQPPYHSGKVAAYCEGSDATFTPIIEDK